MSEAKKKRNEEITLRDYLSSRFHRNKMKKISLSFYLPYYKLTSRYEAEMPSITNEADVRHHRTHIYSKVPKNWKGPTQSTDGLRCRSVISPHTIIGAERAIMTSSRPTVFGQWPAFIIRADETTFFVVCAYTAKIGPPDETMEKVQSCRQLQLLTLAILSIHLT